MIFCCLLLGITSMAQAQCPPTNEQGIHIVQRGETLYSISKKYGTTINDLTRWNRIHATTILKVCQQLIVSDYRVPAEYNSPPPQSYDKGHASPTQYSRQSGNQHIVQVGETVAGLAELYGYTEKRFREFNSLGQEVLTPGSVVLSNDCNCDRIQYWDAPTTTTTYYDPATTTTTYDPNAVPAGSNPTTTTYPDPYKNTGSTHQPQPTPSTSFPAGDGTFMNATEMDMVNEINLMRVDPAGYIKYVNEYVADQRANNGFPISQAVVDELNRQLKRTRPLSQLQPQQCIYTAAQKHGQDLRRMGRTDHVGSDGKWPWDRVLRECTDMTDGNENLVGGPSSVRESVIILLIDEGIPNRGHRETLLRPDWKYAACYYIGQVGSMPNCWVQKFGY